MLSLTVILQGIISGLLKGSIYSLIAMGFTMIYGVMDIVNFAHGHFVMVAMYLTFIVYESLKLDPFVSLFITIPAMFLIGVIIYQVIIKKIMNAPHFTHMMVTMGLMIFLENLINFLFGGDLRGVTTPYTTTSFHLAGISFSLPRLLSSGVALIAVIGFYLFLKKTDFGKAIRAIANNRQGAHLAGINVPKVFMIAFGIGIATAGLAGSVMLPYFLVDPFVGHDFLMKAFAIVIVGGLGSVSGAFIGGLIIGLVETLSSVFLAGSFGNAMVFLVLMITLLLRPSGLMGRSEG